MTRARRIGSAREITIDVAIATTRNTAAIPASQCQRFMCHYPCAEPLQFWLAPYCVRCQKTFVWKDRIISKAEGGIVQLSEMRNWVDSTGWFERVLQMGQALRSCNTAWACRSAILSFASLPGFSSYLAFSLHNSE